jgi:hypothetical protein
MAFAKNVFLNCPFDEDYLPLLRPALYTILHLGLTPKIALANPDSGQPRIERIIAIIQDSKFAIHDISRLQATKVGEYFRLNMPLELGIDIGCRRFKSGKWRQKRCLILETKKYRYQAAISDISNSDIASHANRPINVVREIRNWLNVHADLKAQGPQEIWTRFNEFMAANYATMRANGYSSSDIRKQPIAELIPQMLQWVNREVLL